MILDLLISLFHGMFSAWDKSRPGVSLMIMGSSDDNPTWINHGILQPADQGLKRRILFPKQELWTKFPSTELLSTLVIDIQQAKCLRSRMILLLYKLKLLSSKFNYPRLLGFLKWYLPFFSLRELFHGTEEQVCYIFLQMSCHPPICIYKAYVF